MDTPSEWTFLRDDDFAGKLTPTGGVPSRTSRPDEIALWHLRRRTLLVDTEAGVVCRADGVTRAERPKPTGYGIVYLGRVAGKTRFAMAHRVVWIARHGLIPGLYEVNHRNSRRWDNRIENLDLVRHAENMKHAHLQPYVFVAGKDINGRDDRPEFSPYTSAANIGYAATGQRRLD
jgi:hypothetical protein